MTEVKSTLSDPARRTAGEALQGTLVDLLGLSLLAKQAHWNIVGPRFRTIHIQLDEVVGTARSYADTAAERAASLSVPPDGRAATVAAGDVLPSAKEGWLQDTDVVRLIVESLDGVIGRLRERIAATQDADLVTQDLLIRITAALEEQAWMFQAEDWPNRAEHWPHG